jgi:hypothetical protein
MQSKYFSLILSLLTVIFAASVSAFAQGSTIYNVIPNPLAGNYVSQPFEAQAASEVGDRAAFITPGRSLTTVTVTMSSWACQTGHWTIGCTTAPGATFTHPITLNIYNVGPGNAVGSLLATKTQTQTIPYRPSSDFANCGDARWYDGSSCFNGKAANITFDLTSQNITLPNTVIVGIAYNTSDYGSSPIGSRPCSSTVQGCPYDSLNVALVDPAITLTAGSNPSPNDAYFSSLFGAFYCDGGAGGVGSFRLDPGAGCWTGNKPSIKINAGNPPSNKDQCKGDGWKTFTRADGSTFKNQGDCIQYANTGK